MLNYRNQIYLIFAFLICTLTGSCAMPAFHRLPPTMYVSPTVTYLRDCPALDCPTLVELNAGDELDLLGLPENGWCKVRSVRANLFGWIPRDLLVTTAPPANPSPPAVELPRLPALYVAVKSLILYEEPNDGSAIVAGLEFNQRVEKLAEDQRGWCLIREPIWNINGWAPKWCFEAFMLKTPKILIRPKKPAPPRKEEDAAPPRAM